MEAYGEEDVDGWGEGEEDNQGPSPGEENKADGNLSKSKIAPKQ